MNNSITVEELKEVMKTCPRSFRCCRLTLLGNFTNPDCPFIHFLTENGLEITSVLSFCSIMERGGEESEIQLEEFCREFNLYRLGIWKWPKQREREEKENE